MDYQFIELIDRLDSDIKDINALQKRISGTIMRLQRYNVESAYSEYYPISESLKNVIASLSKIRKEV